MIRLVLASSVPVSVLAGAALLVGPSPWGGVPSGSPMTVASSERLNALHAVDLAGCPPKMLTGEAGPEAAAAPALIRIVTLAADRDSGSAKVTTMPFDGPAGTELVIVLDSEGKLVTAGNAPQSPAPRGPTASSLDCPRKAATEPGVI